MCNAVKYICYKVPLLPNNCILKVQNGPYLLLPQMLEAKILLVPMMRVTHDTSAAPLAVMHQKCHFLEQGLQDIRRSSIVSPCTTSSCPKGKGTCLTDCTIIAHLRSLRHGRTPTVA